ncbi:MAG: tetratricopeptide repeat protein [Candidatus Acidiferrum sp.]
MKRTWIRITATLASVFAAFLLLASCSTNPQKAKLKYLEKGEDYMKKAQYSSAAIEFRNALKVDPKYAEAYYQLALASEAQGDPKSAYNALNQAIAVDPSRMDIRLAHGGLLLGTQNPQYFVEATNDANFVLKQDPKNADAHRLLGMILGREGKFDQALEEFSKVSAMNPGDARSYVDVGLIDLQLQHTSDAEQNEKKAIQVNPKYLAAYSALADIYRVEKEPALAEQALQQGIQANPDAFKLYAECAVVFMSEGKQSQAEQILQQGMQANPNSVPLYMESANFLWSEGKKSDVDGVLAKLSSQMPKSTDVAEKIGDFYFQRKMTDQALSAYQRALSIDGKNLEIQNRIEDLYLSTHQTDLAAKLDEELVKQFPTDVNVRIDHGRLLMAQNRLPEAVDALQKVVADVPDSAQAHFFLAAAFQAYGNFSDANTQLQNAIRVSPGLPIALNALVDLNVSEHNYSVAQLYAEELVKQDAGNLKYRIELGQILLSLGQIKQAAEQFDAAQKLAPNDPSVHAVFASLHVAEKEFPEAEQEYKSALAAAPSNAEILRAYVNFLISQKQQPKAEALIAQFLVQNPNDLDAHLMMGQVQEQAKNYAAAQSETEKAVQLSPKNASGYLQLGQIYRDQHNNDAALQAYQQGMALTAPSAPIMTVIGNIYIDEGNLTKASEVFQKALNIDPNFAIAENNLAWVYAQQGQNLDVALSLAQTAKAKNPQIIDFSDTMAWIMYRQGKYAQALPLLQECVKRDPEFAQYHYHLGMVLMADGQKVEGKAQLQAALHMNNLKSDDAEQARQILAKAQ